MMWEAPRPISGSHPAANSLKRACAGTGSACSRSHAKTLEVSHKDYIKLLRKLRDIPGVKKVFIRSGIRFDYVMADRDDTFLKELCQYHVSGQLKVAPEHICDAVLTRMGKAPEPRLPGLCRQVCGGQPPDRQKAVSRPLSDVLPIRVPP